MNDLKTQMADPNHAKNISAMASVAVKEVCAAYNESVAEVVGKKSFTDIARANFPAGMQSLDGLEKKMTSHLQTTNEYEKLCGQYVRGYKALFAKIVKTLKPRRK